MTPFSLTDTLPRLMYKDMRHPTGGTDRMCRDIEHGSCVARGRRAAAGDRDCRRFVRRRHRPASRPARRSPGTNSERRRRPPDIPRTATRCTLEPDTNRRRRRLQWPQRRLDDTRWSGNWTTRGLADAAKRTKTKHSKSPVASASCPVRDLSSTRVV